MNFSQVDFGVFALKIYGVFVAIAFGLAVWHFYKQLPKKNIAPDFFIHHFWKWVLAGILAGRISVLLMTPSLIIQNPVSLFYFWEGGFHFLGALIGFLGLAIWDLSTHKKPFYKWLDMAMASLFLGILIVDLAAFLTGAFYGKETTLPWGIQYETFGVEILNPVHPVSLYAFIIHFWMLHWIRKHTKILSIKPGLLACKTGVFFFGTDFLLQFLRSDPTLIYFDFIRIEQIFDIVFLGFCLWGKYKIKSN